MGAQSSPPGEGSPQSGAAITGITVAGYKSIRDEQTVEIRPLTILAGANSSGKSSMMQPLLLLKQTLTAPYDPGALRLDGPNIQFSDAEQFFSRDETGKFAEEFRVGLKFGSQSSVTVGFHRQPDAGIVTSETTVADGSETTTLKKGMLDTQIGTQLPDHLRQWANRRVTRGDQLAWGLYEERCFLSPLAEISGTRPMEKAHLHLPLTARASACLDALIYVPGLRGVLGRGYPKTAVGAHFYGRFDAYVAAVIAQWEAEDDSRDLSCVNRDLEVLGLTWKAVARRVSDAQLEIKVGRLPHPTAGGEDDLVNVVDVGIGVSQVLPVLVALQVATSGQLVYLEQPEIHLHPHAQVALARVLSRAAERGVRIVVETHSPLLLLAIQALVADEKLSPELVKLHWFRRSETDGTTRVDTADLDDAGAFGDWPEDFGKVEAEIENRYLNAAEAKLLKK